MLYQGAGASFDSQVVEAFLQAGHQFREIAQIKKGSDDCLIPFLF